MCSQLSCCIFEILLQFGCRERSLVSSFNRTRRGACGNFGNSLGAIEQRIDHAASVFAAAPLLEGLIDALEKRPQGNPNIFPIFQPSPIQRPKVKISLCPALAENDARSR